MQQFTEDKPTLNYFYHQVQTQTDAQAHKRHPDTQTYFIPCQQLALTYMELLEDTLQVCFSLDNLGQQDCLYVCVSEMTLHLLRSKCLNKHLCVFACFR